MLKVFKIRWERDIPCIADERLPFGDNEQFIFKDKIIYFSLQESIFVVVIENKDLALTHRTMFEMAWSQAKDV